MGFPPAQGAEDAPEDCGGGGGCLHKARGPHEPEGGGAALVSPPW